MIKALKPVLLFICFISLRILSFAQENTQLQIARYIGGPKSNTPIGVALTSSQQIVVAGNFDYLQKDSVNYKTINLLVGADSLPGKVLIINPTSGLFEVVINVGSAIYSISMPQNQSNNLLISCNGGLTLINLTNFSVIWKNSMIGTPMKSVYSNDGHIAVLLNKTLYRLNPMTGAIFSSVSIPYDVVNDITILKNKIFVTGFNYAVNSGATYCSKNPGLDNKTLQIAYIAAYQFDDVSKNLTLQLPLTWGFSADQMSCDIAITRGLKLNAGLDGYLYFLGETYTAENIFKYDGKKTLKTNGGVYPPNTYISNDAYNDLSNTGVTTLISYAAKIDPTTGTVISGQFILTRNDSLPNSSMNDFYNVREGAILGDRNGTIYIGGKAGNSIANRNNAYLNTEVAPYAGGDPNLLINGSNFTRRYWKVFTKSQGIGSITNLAISPNYLIALGKLDQGGVYTSNNFKSFPDNPNPDDQFSDMFLLVFKYYSFEATTEVLQPQENFQIRGNNVTFDEVSEVTNVQLTNIQGQNILNSNFIPTKDLNFDYLPHGIYIIKINTKSGSSTKKIFVE